MDILPRSHPEASQSAWRWFPWAITAAFGLVIAINGALFYFAKTSFPGVAAVKPYEVGIAYNRVLEDAARQAAKGWQVTEQILDGHILLRFSDQNGAALAPLSITGSVVRPVGALDRLPLSFVQDSDGGYRADRPIPAPGQWILSFTAQDGGAVTFTATRRLLAP